MLSKLFNLCALKQKTIRNGILSAAGERGTIAVCTYLIANIANLLHPFLPFSSQKVSEWLGIEPKWEEQTISVEKIPSDISILFSKVE